MTRIACPAGRKRMVRGHMQSVWHQPDGSGSPDEDGHCPACWKGGPPSQTTENAPPPAGAKPPAAPPQKPEPKPAGKPGLFKRLGFGDKQTSPEAPLSPPKNVEPSYHCDAPHVIKVAGFVYAAVRFGFNLFDRIAMTKEAGMKTFVERYPKLVVLSENQKAAIEIDPALDMWGRFATGATKLVGAKTQDEAHNIIDTVDLLSGLGALMLYGGAHIGDAWKKGAPFREAKRLARREAAEARKREVDLARNIAQGEGGVVPAA
jgi:hypothetical protein